MSAVAASRSLGIRAPTQTREMSDLVGKFLNRIDRTDLETGIIPAAIAPREHERAALTERKASLLASLEPDADRTRRVLIGLLSSFPAFNEDEETARFILAACARACSKVPAWSVEEAAGRFLEGRTRIQWSMDRRPTPPQILAEASHCVLEVEAELHRINQVLGAEIVDTETTAEERQDALDAWERLKREMGRSNVISQRTDEEIATERGEMQRANERFRAREARHKAALAADAEARS